MREQPSGLRKDETAETAIALTVSCSCISGHRAECDGISITHDCSAESADCKDPVIQVRIRQSALSCCYRSNDQCVQFAVGSFDRHSVSILLGQLSRALGAAGIGLRKHLGLRNAARQPAYSVSPKKRAARVLPKWRLLRVLVYIDANISNRITLAGLSDAAGLSRMYFAGQFRAATGERPHHFVLRRRIQYAQRLLVNTSQTLVEIALNAGFQTQGHFTTIFRRFIGDTPHRWRREHGLPYPATERRESYRLGTEIDAPTAHNGITQSYPTCTRPATTSPPEEYR